MIDSGVTVVSQQVGMQIAGPCLGEPEFFVTGLAVVAIFAEALAEVLLVCPDELVHDVP